MRIILSIISLPFVLLGLLLWSAAMLVRAAAAELFKRAKLTMINNKQPQRREVI